MLHRHFVALTALSVFFTAWGVCRAADAGDNLKDATATSSPDTPPGYAVINTTDAGQSIATRKKSASVETAITATLPDLSAYFGSKVTVVRAFQDTKDQQTGGASLTATLKDHAVKGLISCKIRDSGAAIAVVYANANASAEDWKKLLTTPAAPAKAGDAPVKLREYRFPDETGTIGLAEGYTCKAQSAMGEVEISGPHDQKVLLNFTLGVVTPNSMAVHTQQQLEANARQFGQRPPPRPTMFIAPFTNPVEVYGALTPQINAISRQQNGPLVKLTKLLSQDRTPESLSNGRAALATFLFDQATPQGTQHRQAMARIEISPTSSDSFMFSFSGISSPQEQFDRDRSVMLAITNSLQLNGALIAQKAQQNVDAQKQWFAAQQKMQRERSQAFDEQNRAWEKRSQAQSRSADDFDEVIRGYRTVEDTTTGEKSSVDLGNVDHIVDDLNAASPGRYRQIPLRDEVDPTPGR